MSADWGRFTLRGGAEIEKQMTALAREVAERCRAAMQPGEYRALVMLGGFGRGEGGVVTINGEERPHNNIDFLLITNSSLPSEQARLRRSLEEACRPAAEEYDIPIDIGTIPEGKLRRAGCLVIWHDMRHGHKTILGDAAFVPSLKQFSRDRIPAWDVRNLIVNRGTLLVINDQVLSRGSLTHEERRLIVKHAIKAIIGYGDALLYFLGDYHWSYAEKQIRMRRHADVDPDFRSVYEAACEFRFRPAYEAYLERDPNVWMEELRRALAPIHLLCESKRLKRPGLDWNTYAQAALTHAAFDEPFAARAWAKKGLNAVRGRRLESKAVGSLARLGYRMAGLRGVLPIVFPAVAYDLPGAQFRELTREALRARSVLPDELRRAYLRAWGEVGDANFASVLRKYKLSLDATEPVS